MAKIKQKYIVEQPYYGTNYYEIMATSKREAMVILDGGGDADLVHYQVDRNGKARNAEIKPEHKTYGR